MWAVPLGLLLIIAGFVVAILRRLLRQERCVAIAREADLLYLGTVTRQAATVVGIDCGLYEEQLRWWRDSAIVPPPAALRGATLVEVGPGGRVALTPEDVRRLFLAHGLDWYDQAIGRGRVRGGGALLAPSTNVVGFRRFYEFLEANPEFARDLGASPPDPQPHPVARGLFMFGGAFVAAALILGLLWITGLMQHMTP